MKEILTADLHIGLSSDSWIEENGLPTKVNDTFKSLERIKKYAVKHKIGTIKILGDIYETNRPIPKYHRMFIEWLNECEELGLEVIMFPGNHDESISNEHSLSPISEIVYENIHCLNSITSQIENGVNCIYVPHIPKNNFPDGFSEDDIKKYLQKQIKTLIKKNKTNILYGHIHAVGAMTGTEQRIMKGGINFFDTKMKGINLYCLGHIHKHQVFKKGEAEVAYPGSVVRNDFGEENEDKGFVVLNKKTLEKKFVKLPTRPYSTINIDLVKKSNYILDEKAIEKKYSGHVVRIRIKSSEENKTKISMSEIIDAYSKHCFISKHEIDIIKSKNKSISKDVETDDELLKSFISSLTGISAKNKKLLYKKCLDVYSGCSLQTEKKGMGIGNIKLGTLELKNFRSFPSLVVDFSKITVAGIIGQWSHNPEMSNGSGKSTMIAAICWVLYGVYPEGLSDDELFLNFDPSNKMSGRVTLPGSKGEAEIVRTKTKSKTDLRLIVNGKDISGKVRETQAMINELLGMDNKLFMNTIYFTEKNQETFCKATPTERKIILKNVLSLDIWDDCLSEAKKNYSEVNNEIEKIEYSLEDLKEVVDSDFDEKGTEGRIKKGESILSSLSEEISKKRDSMMDIKSVIDNEKRIKDDYNDALESLREASGELEDLNNDLLEINEDINKSYKKIDKSYNFKSEWSKIERLRKSEIEVNNKLVEIKQLGSLRKEEAKKLSKVNGAKCPQCGQIIKDKDKILEGLKKEISDLKEKYFAKDEELKSLVKKRDLLSTKYVNQESCRKDIESLKEDGDSTTSNIKKLKEKIKKLKKTKELKENLFKKIDKKNSSLYNKLQKEIEELEEKKDKSLSLIHKLKAELKAFKKNKKTLKEKKNLLDEKNEELSVLNLSKNVFGKNGVVAKRISDSLDKLKEVSNEIYSSIGYGDKEITFETLKENKDKKIVDSLDIYIVWKDVNRRYETYSGGESSIINFSIRLAISEMLSKDCVFTPVFLDEVFGKMDAPNRETMFKVINHLKKRFSQILTVSHTEMRDSFPSLIFIEKNSDTELSKLKKIII